MKQPKHYTEFQRKCALSFYPINKAIEKHTDFKKWNAIYDFSTDNRPENLQLCIVVGLYGDVYIARYYKHYRVISKDDVHEYYDAFVVYTDSIDLVTKNEETGELEPFFIEGRPVLQNPKLWRPVPKDLIKILDTLHDEFDAITEREKEYKVFNEKVQKVLGKNDSTEEDIMTKKIQKNDLRKIETPDSKRAVSILKIAKNKFERTDDVIRPIRFNNKKED